MKTFNNILCLAGWLGFVSILHGQSLQEQQYQAYLTTGKALWSNSVKRAQTAHGTGSFEAVMAAYGLLNNTMASQDEQTFDQWVDQVVKDLEVLIEKNPQWGEPKAVLSTVYGLKIAYSPMKGMIYGSKSGSLIEAALSDQPESPLVQKLYGAYKLYTPKMFGGNPARAVEAYQEAISLYESNNSTQEWLYLDTLVGLAMALHKSGQANEAIITLEQALKIEPKFYWAQSLLKSYQGER